MKALAAKRILLGVTGGIAAYKVADLARRLIDDGAEVQVVMTQAATAFITPTTFQALTGKPVYTETLDARMENSMAHINLSRQADLIIIAPASADFMAKVANGFADDLLSTLCLARGQCPMAIVPAMNKEMWANAATQRNTQTIIQDEIAIWGPGSGYQACGEVGDGRMLEPLQIVALSRAFFQDKHLAGKSVLITAGPTEEAIDPVRVISNRSSGKTGYQIARAAYEAGAKVTLISGPTQIDTPYGVERINVRSARQMHEAVLAHIDEQDIFISVAAVADWYIANYQDQKVKKSKDNNIGLDLKFAPNPDILAQVAKDYPKVYSVGFAAETQNLHEHAQNKRLRKGIPLLVGNLVQEAMDIDTTRMVLFDDTGAHELPVQTKPKAAKMLIQAIAKRINSSAA